MAAGDTPHLMSFVSEKQLDDARKKKQEEWEKNRKPGQSEEMPEEVHDSRPLYERLRDQKEQKQMEWDEQHKLKNLIYQGLDDDEAIFLNFVNQRQAELEERQFREEIQQVKDFREAQTQLEAPPPPSLPISSSSSSPPPPSSPPPSSSSTSLSKRSPTSIPSLPSSVHKSQLQLLAGMVRTKRQKSKGSQNEDDTTSAKKATPSIEPAVSQSHERGHKVTYSEEKEESLGFTKSLTDKEIVGEQSKGQESEDLQRTTAEPVAEKVGKTSPQASSLKGLCVYSDSDSGSNSDDG